MRDRCFAMQVNSLVTDLLKSMVMMLINTTTS